MEELRVEELKAAVQARVEALKSAVENDSGVPRTVPKSDESCVHLRQQLEGLPGGMEQWTQQVKEAVNVIMSKHEASLSEVARTVERVGARCEEVLERIDGVEALTMGMIPDLSRRVDAVRKTVDDVVADAREKTTDARIKEIVDSAVVEGRQSMLQHQHEAHGAHLETMSVAVERLHELEGKVAQKASADWVRELEAALGRMTGAGRVDASA